MLYVFACFYFFSKTFKEVCLTNCGWPEILPQTFHMCALFPLLWFPDTLVGTDSSEMYGGSVVQDENMIPIGMCLFYLMGKLI